MHFANIIFYYVYLKCVWLDPNTFVCLCVVCEIAHYIPLIGCIFVQSMKHQTNFDSFLWSLSQKGENFKKNK